MKKVVMETIGTISMVLEEKQKNNIFSAKSNCKLQTAISFCPIISSNILSKSIFYLCTHTWPRDKLISHQVESCPLWTFCQVCF